jgi:CheY-like chemotaxis protein
LEGGTVEAILVVDDSSFLRKRILDVLRPQGYELQEAGSGVSALAALSDRTFACVLTDLHMPDMDGFGLLAGIRDRGIETPVIVLTADIQKTTRTRCEALGAKQVLNKPVNPDDLRAALTQALAMVAK